MAAKAKKHGPIKDLVPLMAVAQRNKEKVGPVLDFRELNTFIEAFTANTYACIDKLRDWRRFGEDVSIICEGGVFFIFLSLLSYSYNFISNERGKGEGEF